jgi:hypothetical protein
MRNAESGKRRVISGGEGQWRTRSSYLSDPKGSVSQYSTEPQHRTTAQNHSTVENHNTEPQYSTEPQYRTTVQ